MGLPQGQDLLRAVVPVSCHQNRTTSIPCTGLASKARSPTQPPSGSCSPPPALVVGLKPSTNPDTKTSPSCLFYLMHSGEGLTDHSTMTFLNQYCSFLEKDLKIFRYKKKKVNLSDMWLCASCFHSFPFSFSLPFAFPSFLSLLPLHSSLWLPCCPFHGNTAPVPRLVRQCWLLTPGGALPEPSCQLQCLRFMLESEEF